MWHKYTVYKGRDSSFISSANARHLIADFSYYYCFGNFSFQDASRFIHILLLIISKPDLIRLFLNIKYCCVCSVCTTLCL